MIRLALFELAALSLFWCCFCRSSFTSKRNTKRDVRWAFTLLGVVAIVCIVAPLWDYRPDPIAIIVLVAAALVQLVTDHHWRGGLPKAFQKEAP